MKKIKLGIFIFGIIIILIGIIAANTFKNKKNIVGRYITNEHYRYSPVELMGEVYFPSSVSLGDKINLKSIGLLGRKDEGIINFIMEI